MPLSEQAFKDARKAASAKPSEPEETKPGSPKNNSADEKKITPGSFVRLNVTDFESQQEIYEMAYYFRTSESDSNPATSTGFSPVNPDSEIYRSLIDKPLNFTLERIMTGKKCNITVTQISDKPPLPNTP